MKHKLFTETGALNQEGIKEVRYLLGEEVDILIDNCESENDLLILKAVLLQFISEKISLKRIEYNT